MYRDQYPTLDAHVRSALANAHPPTTARLRAILEQSQAESLPITAVAELLTLADDERGQRQLDVIRDHLYERFRPDGRSQAFVIAPLYLSSHCVDTCTYCQYSVHRIDVQRTRLSLAELATELTVGILPEGIRVVELTLATDPFFSVDVLSTFVARTKSFVPDQGSGVLLCSDFLSREDYSALRASGLWGMVQWDETLDRDRFNRLHKGAPRKSDFAGRMDNHDRALQAGLRVATGCLFGLADFRYDTLMQIGKARYLRTEYGTGPFTFGTPRVKPTGNCHAIASASIDDFHYELALMAYKLAEPSVARWLQTRESMELNMRNLLDQDLYTYRCGDVKPGGYVVNIDRIDKMTGRQFAVQETEQDQFENNLHAIGFSANYAWIAR